jgi:enoyl-[acyl-carrier-protein] reductase (NADH)
MSYKRWRNTMTDKTFLKRLPLLEDVAKVAALVASDYASAVTGVLANVTWTGA